MRHSILCIVCKACHLFINFFSGYGVPWMVVLPMVMLYLYWHLRTPLSVWIKSPQRTYMLCYDLELTKRQIVSTSFCLHTVPCTGPRHGVSCTFVVWIGPWSTLTGRLLMGSFIQVPGWHTNFTWTSILAASVQLTTRPLRISFFECKLACILVAGVYFNLGQIDPTAGRFTVEELLFGFCKDRQRVIPSIFIFMLQVMKHTISGWLAAIFAFTINSLSHMNASRRQSPNLNSFYVCLGQRCRSPAQIHVFEREWLARSSLGH